MASIKFGLFGYRFKTDDNWLYYKSAYGKSFKVLKADIDSVSLNEAGRGKNKLQINGNGTVLANVELPKAWCQKAQEFIYREIGKIK